MLFCTYRLLLLRILSLLMFHCRFSFDYIISLCFSHVLTFPIFFFTGDRLFGALLLFRRLMSVDVLERDRCSLVGVFNPLLLRTLGGHLRQSVRHGRGRCHLRVVLPLWPQPLGPPTDEELFACLCPLGDVFLALQPSRCLQSAQVMAKQGTDFFSSKALHSFTISNGSMS